MGTLPHSHQSVLTGEPFTTQAASWGRRDVRRCLPTDLHSAVFTGRRLQTQPSIPRGVKKRPVLKLLVTCVVTRGVRGCVYTPFVNQSGSQRAVKLLLGVGASVNLRGISSSRET
jgi:hypothetical protein